jgi:hypothetical protein
MNSFAFEFSERLAIFAANNRPASSELTIDQCKYLASLAGYNFVLQDTFPFTIFHPDGKNGLDGGISVVWQVRAFGRRLEYFPYAQSHYIRGNSTKISDEMQEVLSVFLPRLGYKEYIPLLLPESESTVRLHKDLQHSGDHVTVMLLSEFWSKYGDLYKYMKHYFQR